MTNFAFGRSKSDPPEKPSLGFQISARWSQPQPEPDLESVLEKEDEPETEPDAVPVLIQVLPCCLLIFIYFNRAQLDLEPALDEEDECQVIGLMVGHKDDSEENCCVHATQTTKGLVVLASLTRSLQGSKSMKSDTTSRDSF